MIVLDTNVVSELMRPNPDQHVVGWIAARPAADLFTTSITQAEILHGVMLLPSGKRRTAIAHAAETMFIEDFGGRILPFGSEAAHPYAQLATGRRRVGHPISHFDAQIAAIAYVARASIATRNTADFEGCGVPLVNPWKD